METNVPAVTSAEPAQGSVSFWGGFADVFAQLLHGAENIVNVGRDTGLLESPQQQQTTAAPAPSTATIPPALLLVGGLVLVGLVLAKKKSK